MNPTTRALATRWFEEVWNQRREESIHELLAENAPGHMEGQEITGPGDFLPVHREMLKAMPDMRIAIEEVLSDDHDAVVRWKVTACQGNVVFSGMTWFKFRNGKIVEGWDRWNYGAFLQRLQSVKELL
jgi:predicted SnoaL-like aldol condensation-catalyzing enzyme